MNKEQPCNVDAKFQQDRDTASRLVGTLLKSLLENGAHPYAVANAMLGHAVAIFDHLDGRAGAIDFIETSLSVLRDLDERATARDVRH